jgi:hypothetical protein
MTRPLSRVFYGKTMATTPTQLPVPSEKPQDLKFNAGKIDAFVTSLALKYNDRFGNAHYTIEGIKQLAFDAIRNFGYITFDSFEDGAALTLPNQALRLEATGEYYRWDGGFPKVVPAGSTPNSTGGIGTGKWLSVGDAVLRSMLASSSGASMVGTENNMTVQERLDRTVIYLDDILPAKDGSVDCAPALNAFLATVNGTSVRRLVGTKGSIYKFEDTINLNGVVGLEIDFGWATVNDNVQGIIPVSANRSKHLFSMYQASGAKVHRFYLNELSTRSNSGGVDIPTCIFWVGGQYQGDELTEGCSISDIKCLNGKLGMMFIAVMGETRNGSVSNIHLEGDFSYGINFEYGEPPEDPGVDPTWDNGRHPYNWKVFNFNGFNLHNSVGFLRCASCFNIKFDNCVGSNVKSFIYVYSGDRSISRVSENVVFKNCKLKIDEAVLPTAGSPVQVLFVNNDGSTGTPLPSWTNYNHTVVFKNCEFWGSTGINQSTVRVYGNQGTTSFEQCIIRNSYFGVNIGPSSNPDYISDNAVSFRDCVFVNNYRDVNITSSYGVCFDHCQFKNQNSNSALTPVGLGAGAYRTQFLLCKFSGLSSSKSFVTIGVDAKNTKFVGNDFSLFSIVDAAIDSQSRSYGSANTTNGNLTASGITNYGIIGENSTRLRTLESYGGSPVNYDIADFYTSTGSYTFTRITNGGSGDEVILRGASVSSSVVLTQAASGVSNTERLVLKGNVTRTVAGNDWAVRLKKTTNGWYEL